jgi:NAD(P)-dependent dehydrogenase (short-subunit alcohol dehydrogenase family)
MSTALITGGSRGFGLALATELALMRLLEDAPPSGRYRASDLLVAAPEVSA